MNPLRVYARALDQYRRAVEARAIFEAYGVWRGLWPWRWLPQGKRFDRLRARTFRSLGRRFIETFAPLWVDEYYRASGFRPVGITPSDTLACQYPHLGTSSERAWRNLIDRAQVELREIANRLPTLDPRHDNSACADATAALRTPDALRGIREMSRQTAWLQPPRDDAAATLDQHGA